MDDTRAGAPGPGVHATGDHLDVLSERRASRPTAGRGWTSPTPGSGPLGAHRQGRGQAARPHAGHPAAVPWLGFAALAALLFAVLLQTVHQVRQRGTPRPKVAAHVRNTA
ncbi:hypothetical protein NKH77_53325 [Streptomyces sp. M19]